MRKIVILLLCLIGSQWLPAQTTVVVKGLVYHDLNSNGKHDKTEPGIVGVPVSNGSDVTQSDAGGRYEIRIPADDGLVFVVRPSAYSYPLNDDMLPQFYYLHKPKGSPALKYEAVAPTGELPASVDFGLLTGCDSEVFSVVISSDPQAYTPEQVTFYQTDIAEELKVSTDAVMGFTLGDIVGDRPDLFPAMNKATALTGLPWHHVLGNHDMNYDATTNQYADESFEKFYGPSTYSFNHGKVHFFVMNNVIYPNTYNDQQYIGGFSDQQFRYLENMLPLIPKDHLLVFLMHIPLYNEAQWGETFRDVHRERFFNLLKDRPYTLSLSGHTHTQAHFFFDGKDGWKQAEPHHHYTVGTASGDWWSGAPKANGVPVSTMRDGTPNGYNILQFDGNTYRYDYKAASFDSAWRMRIYGPKVVPANGYFRGEFYVNFFQGSEQDTVFYQLDGGEWKRMRYVIEEDPHVCGLRYEWDHAEVLPAGTRPSNPSPCYHLWKARMPNRTGEGTHTINIRVADRFGRTYRDSFQFRAVTVTVK